MLRQRGFTLIEVLVAVIVLAIGLLGMAGLQATALRYTSTAYQRSQATNLTYDILDRMRANVIVARAGAYNIAMGATAPTGTTLAATDLREWLQALANTLPLATASIAQPNAANLNHFRIRIQWDDDRDPTTPIPQSFQQGIDTEL